MEKAVGKTLYQPTSSRPFSHLLPFYTHTLKEGLAVPN
jgi:hypothetical protein